ncbi:hypothetical protein Tco_1579223, partial [Tanacetum coccineum]
VRMSKEDEEKMVFHIEGGILCYTNMPKGLKNLGATYQRMTDKVLVEQKGRNVELSLDKCVFGMEEGKFLGYVVTAEGTRADPKKLKVITHRSTPEGLKQESRTLGIIKICAYDKNFSSIWTYTTMMLLRVCNHHGGKCVHPKLN